MNDTHSAPKGTSMGTAATILAISSVASYGIGLVRDRVFAHLYGASPTLDAYYAAFTIPDIIFNLLTAGIVSHAVFIPVLNQYYQRGDQQHAWRIASSFLNVITVVITIVAVIAWIFMPQLFSLVAAGFTGEQFELGVNLTRILLLQPILFGLSNTFGALLVSVKRFSSYAFAPAIYNVGIVVTTLTLHDTYGIYAAMIGVIVGAVLHLGIRLWDLQHMSFQYQWVWNLRDPGFIRMLMLSIPKTLGLIAGQANLYAYTRMGSMMEAGTISIFNFARNLQSFPVSLIGIAMATASLPTLAAHANAAERGAFTHAIDRATKYILFLALPATAGLLTLGHDIVTVVLHSGAFDPTAARITTSVLAFLTLAITFECMKYLLATTFYAQQDTTTPIVITVIGMVVNITLSWKLRLEFGVAAFGIGFLCGEVLQVILMEWKLRTHLVSGERSTPLTVIKILIATVLMTVAVVASQRLFMDAHVALRSMASIAIGLIVYLATAWQLRMPELSVIPAIIQRITRRRT